MKKEYKELLLQDLCARLPYGVKIELTWWVMDEGTSMNTTLEPDHIEQLLNDEDGVTEIKPYLRPMSSMTKEERKEYNKTCIVKFRKAGPGYTYDGWWEYYDTMTSFDYLNAHHFDYRGLIEKGLALEAPEGMYN